MRVIDLPHGPYGSNDILHGSDLIAFLESIGSNRLADKAKNMMMARARLYHGSALSEGIPRPGKSDIWANMLCRLQSVDAGHNAA